MDPLKPLENADFARAVVDTAPTLIYVFDLVDGRNKYMSPQIDRMFGYTPADIERLGTSLLSTLCHPDDLDQISQHHSAIRASDGSGPFEITYRMRHRDGSWKWLVSREMPFARNVDGKITQIVGSALDVTELKESEERLATALRSGDLGVHDYDVGSGDIRWDQRTREIWGIGPDEPVTYELFESGIHPDDVQMVRDAVAAAMDPQGGGTYLAEFRVISRKDATVRWVAADANVTFEFNKPVRFVGLVHDVTERHVFQDALDAQILEQKRAAAALQESEQRYRTLFDRAAVGLAEVAADGSWLRVNQALCDMLGYAREEFMSRTWQDLTHPDDVDADLSLVNACHRGEIDTYRLAKRYVRKNGDVVFAQLTVACVRQSSGTVEYFLPIVEDVTAKRSAEHALQASEARYRAVVQDQTEMLCRFRHDGTLILVNQAYARAHGMDPSSMEDRQFYEFLAPTQAERVRSVISKLSQENASITTVYRVKRHDGVWRWEEWVNRILPLADQIVFQATGRDVTSQLTAEAQMRQSRERLRLAARAASLTYIALDLVSRSITRLDNFADVMGFDIPDGTPLETADQIFLSMVHVEDREQLRAHVDAAHRGISPALVEYRICTHGGVRWLESRSHGELGEAGKVRRIFVVTTDVTKRKTTELQLEFATRELEHRSKNLLTVIQSIASVTARSNSSINDFVHSFGQRVEALSRSQDLLVHGSTRTVKISKLVEDQLSIAAGVDQRTRISGPLINLNPDAAQALGMALHELATNSIKHGALSCEAGHVHIFWFSTNDDLVFTWQESGGPEVSLPKRRGFGRTILEQVTPSKLAGRAELRLQTRRR